MLRVGLTGALGSGKTTVLKDFKRLGCRVFAADAVVHAELRCNKKLKNRIRRLFGAEVFRRGAIDRGLLARKVFQNQADLRALNALIHPIVKKRLFQVMRSLRAKRGRGLFVAEIPLLFEAGFDRFFDATVVVAARSETIRRRLAATSRSKAGEWARRMRCQMPAEDKIARCDFIIDNNGTEIKTWKQVKGLIRVFQNMEDGTWKN